MQVFLLREGVLNDNILLLPNKGKIFKGGFIALIKEYKFQNAWSNSEHVKRFRNKKRLTDYLNKKYGEVELDLTETCLDN